MKYVKRTYLVNFIPLHTVSENLLLRNCIMQRSPVPNFTRVMQEIWEVQVEILLCRFSRD